MRQLQKKLKSRALDVKDDDPFELFVAATDIRYCYYAETHKILGSTYGMCVLQVKNHVLFRSLCNVVLVVCRILKHSLRTCLHALWKQWREGGWLSFC